MKKLDTFTKIFFAVSVTFNTLVMSPVKSEDLRYQFNSQESATWENAQYEEITTNVRGERLIIRFFVDKNSNIYEFAILHHRITVESPNHQKTRD